MAQCTIHIGKILQEYLRAHGISVAWLARQISHDRSHLYRAFRSQSVDTQLLLSVSEVLQHDFFAYYSNSLSSTREQ